MIAGLVLAAVFTFTPSPAPGAIHLCRAWSWDPFPYLPQTYGRSCRDRLTPDGTCWALVGPRLISCDVEGNMIRFPDPVEPGQLIAARVYAVWPEPAP